METYIARNKLQLVDRALNTMNDAGYGLDGDDIAFVWRVARDEATSEEIEVWTLAQASRLNGRPPQSETLHRLTAMASDLNDDLARLGRGIADLRASTRHSR